MEFPGVPPQKGQVRLPRIYDYNFDDPGDPKPWRENVEEIHDYFNYGFNEETWRLHVEKVRAYHAKLAPAAAGRSTGLLINKDLPVDMGGFGDPVNPLLRASELFQSFTQNSERFWLGLDLASSNNSFWNSFKSLVRDHSLNPDNAAPLPNSSNASANFFFNKYFIQIKEFDKKAGLEVEPILSKANLQRIRNRGPSRLGDRHDTGHRQHQYLQNQTISGRDDGLLGRRGALAAVDKKDPPGKLLKKV